MIRALLSIVMLLAIAASAGAQSLAEVAKKEEARRKEVKTPSKVYTNEDLKKYGAPTSAAPASPAQPPTTAPAGTAAAQPPSTETTANQPAAGDKEPVKDEDWWRARMTEARDKLERNRVLVDSLQTRANALLNDFTARDDPAQRALLTDERTKTLAELQRVKDEIAAATKALADIEEEARREGVPPGWLR